MKKIFLFFSFLTIASISEAQYWMQTGGSTTIDEGMDVASDSNNNTYTAGYFTSVLTMDGNNLTASGLSDIFIVKTDSIGKILWLKSAGGLNIDKALSIDADASGNIVVTGLFYASADFDGQMITSSGQQDMFVAKYDSSGTLLWVRKAGGTEGDAGNGVAFDPAGNVIVTGEFSDTCAFGTTILTSADGSIDVFTAKYDSNGNLLWAKKGSGLYTDRGTDVSTDATGNIYVTGMFSDTVTFDNVHNNAMHNALFLIKYNPSGTELWFRWMGSASVTAIGGIAVHNNRVNITGNFSGTLFLFGNSGNPTLNGAHPNNIFVIRYNLAGNLIWKHADGSESEVTAQAITTKNNGEVLIAGNFKCRFSDFSAQYGAGIFCSVGYWDTYIASYNNSGDWQWSRQFGGKQDDYVYGISVIRDSIVSSTGSFNENFVSPVNPASFIPHGAVSFYDTQFGNYCSDTNYGNYIRYLSYGNSDIFINTNVDLSRQPYDYFERSGTVCSRPFNDICVVRYGGSACVDSVISCGIDSLEVNLHQVDSALRPAFSYLWNTSATANTLPVFVSGYYSVSVTSYDGCFSNTDSVYFLMNPVPPIPLITDSKGINIDAMGTSPLFLCQPDSVLLTCTNVGVNNVQWSGFPAGQNPVWVYSTGTYSVTFTNSYGCLESNFIEIFFDSVLSFPPVIPKLICEEDTDNNDSIMVCLGDAFHIFVYDSITNPLGMDVAFPGLYAAEWDVIPVGPLAYSAATIAENTNTFITIQPGDFDFLIKVWVIRGNICLFDSVYVEMTLHVTINPAPSGFINVTITGPADICPGISTMLIAQPDSVDFLWSTSETNDTIYVTQPGTYNVSAFEPVINSFGCTGAYTGSAAHSLTGYTQPVVYIPSNGVICPGDSLELICTGTGIFNWQGPNGYAGNQWSIFVNIPGFYYCIETVGPGCDLVSNTIEVFQYSTPFLDAFPNTAVCYNDSVLLTVIAGPGSTIQWLPPLSGNASTQVIYTAGTYYCDVTSCGIITSLSYTVVQYPAPATPVITFISPDLVSTSAVSYQWFFNGSLINGATSQTYTPLQNGSYTVEITDSNGCTAMSLSYFYSDVGFPELYLNEFTISPNPANSSMQIIFTSENFIEGKTIIRLRNILGEELLKIKAHKKETIYLRSFSNGMYFVEIVSENKVLKRKIVISH
ncbi:MAG TPA: T9SS type A sorting domain-containing protein [Bacteroidia bacterium]|nr:T9SS type A sorting domain-containing protein [Bacteroidia bacterium]